MGNASARPGGRRFGVPCRCFFWLLLLGAALLEPGPAPLFPSIQVSVADQLRELKSDDVAARRKAASQLAAMTQLPADVLPALRASLKDTDEPTAKDAAKALVNAGTLALHEIDLALQDPDRQVRSRMASALAGARQLAPDFSPLLIRAFRDADVDAQVYAAQASAKVGVSILPLLQAALADSDARTRQGACMAMESLGPQARPGMQSLLKALADAEPSVRHQAAFALAKIDPQSEQAVPVLVEALNDPYWLIRSKACQALILMQHARLAVPVLLQHVSTDPDDAIRGLAAGALATIGSLDSRQVGQLAAALETKDALLRQSVAAALGALAPEAVAGIPALVRAINHEDSWPRNAEAEALGRFGAVALPEIGKLLKSDDIYVRQAAIHALRQMKPLPAEAVRVLIAALEDRNDAVSDGAAGVLLQEGIKGDWFKRYQTIQEERKAAEKAKARIGGISCLFRVETCGPDRHSSLCWPLYRF